MPFKPGTSSYILEFMFYRSTLPQKGGGRDRNPKPKLTALWLFKWKAHKDHALKVTKGVAGGTKEKKKFRYRTWIRFYEVFS